MRTDAGNRYTFQSPGFGYSLNAGAKWAFTGALNLAFPVAAAENGGFVSFGNVYAAAFALDLSLGVDRRIPLSTRIELAIGPRLHGLYTTLEGDTAYRTFQSAVLGGGLAAQVAYATDERVFGAPIIVAGLLRSSLDVVDILHGNRLDYGVSFIAGAAVGVRL